MDNTPSDRTTAPASLLSQWWTLGAILADKRAAGRHAKVAWIILDRHMRKSGNARASIRYIEQASGLSQHTVIKACRELVKWGYFDQHLGSGTRPTEYTPKWLVLHPSTALASAEPICSTSAEPMCSTTAASAEPICSESYLHEPADKAGLNVSTGEVAAAPDADGLSATAPASGFEEAWKAYDRHGNKSKARAAWDAIQWSRYDYGPEHVIERARSWAATAKPGQRRMPLERWLEAERFDEADRTVEPHLNPAPTKPTVTKTTRRPRPPHAVRRDATVDAVENTGLGCRVLWKWHDAMPGEAPTHWQHYMADDFEQLQLSTGRDRETLIGTRVVIYAGDDYSTFELHPANDNAPAREAANG